MAVSASDPDIAASQEDFLRFWFVTIDANINHLSEKDVGDIIEQILNDENGWRKFGFEFQRIPTVTGLLLRYPKGYKMREMGDKKYWRHIFHLRLSTSKTIGKECGFTGLSCANRKENMILFDLDRWLHGSEGSGLDLSDYIKYLVYHEVGHLLMLDHKECGPTPNDVCSIMCQQTIANGRCKGNPYPLPTDMGW